MLFKSACVSKTWDTWMAFDGGAYYLLTSETAPGDGFGVATSTDGLRWTDHGRVLEPSDKMIRYLGGGSVWQETNFPATRR